MSRSLPLSPAAPEPQTPQGNLTGSVAVYDPAMCCSTGVCGVGVDPALLQIARDLRWLAARGVQVSRSGLGQEPQAFIANPRIQGLMQALGDGALPAVLVNDIVLVHGCYPTRADLVDALTAAGAPATPSRELRATDAEGGGCAPGSGCC